MNYLSLIGFRSRLTKIKYQHSRKPFTVVRKLIWTLHKILNMTKFFFHYFLIVCFPSLLCQTNLLAQTADVVITNGKIFTSDTKKLYVQALAIKGNKIIASGTNEAILKLANSKTKKIDVQGKTVVPGFNDAHDHLGWYAPVGLGYTYTEMQFAGLSKEAVLDSVSRLVKVAKPNQWIHGFIGTQIFFDNSMRNALDSIAPNNPVLLQIWWGHGQVVNGKAILAAGLSDSSQNPVGGWYEKAGNKITAVHQNAQLPFWDAWVTSEPENLIKGLRSYSEEQLRGGITTVQQMSSTMNGGTSINAFRKANLPQRIRIIAWPHSTPNGRKLWEWNFKNNQPTPLTYISGIKYIIDGSPGSENALRTIPYPGRPGWYGRFNYPIDTMKQILREALTSNRQLMMHMTADSSFSVVLSLIKQAGTAAQWRAKRVRIEHNCVGDISTTQKAFLKDYGIIMMQTAWYCMASPVRSLLKNGVILGFSPDGTTNPFLDIMLLTTTASNPNENLTREEAVIAYTKTNAYAEFKEKEKGTLMPGMLADLAVLSQDIFTIPSPQLPATKSVLTMINGKIMYEANH
jgi:predicted amidohydrolase YtcJ